MIIGATWPHRSGGTGVTDIFTSSADDPFVTYLAGPPATRQLPQGHLGAHGCAVPCWVASSPIGEQRSGRGIGMSSLNLVRPGALGALLAGVAWTALGLVDIATVGGRGSEVLSSTFLEKTLYLVALVGTLGGIVGLHARQT